RDIEAAARVADVGIGADRFRNHGDAGEVVGGLYRFDVGTARFHRPAQTAEQVDLVADIEPGIVKLAIGQAGVGAERRTRLPALADRPEIGRASCRERVWLGGGGGL